MRRHKKLTAALILAALLVGPWLWALSAPIRGNVAARWDLHRGRYEVLTYGLPPRSRAEYARLLKERYGVQLRAVAGCIVNESLRSYASAYNKVTVVAINEKAGHDVFKECSEEAERRYPPLKW